MDNEMAASMLSLPRELYLIICSHLTPPQLTTVAQLCKDHYLAVQQPLYERVSIRDNASLINLVRTLTRAPVVSHISPRQRLRWQSLTDEQLRERDIKRLNVVLDAKLVPPKKDHVTGAVLSRCIGAVARRCGSVKIELELHGPFFKLLSELDKSPALPNVRSLVLFLGGGSADRISADNAQLCDLVFSGTVLPDLQSVEINTLHSDRSQLPVTLASAARANDGSHWDDPTRRASGAASVAPFYGLKKMTCICIKYTKLLDASVLQSLFGSSIIPQKLTKLEIVNCPALHGVRELSALSMLLQRGLQLLQHLKLHIESIAYDTDQEHTKYSQAIDEKPEEHLCNIVRELGQNIKFLDLALPFVCNRIFVLAARDLPSAYETLEYPSIPREPQETLPERIVNAGYKYRRLICWNGICRHEHDWDVIVGLAGEQGERMSWEVVSNKAKRGSWHVSGCLPVTFRSRDALKRTLTLEER